MMHNSRFTIKKGLLPLCIMHYALCILLCACASCNQPVQQVQTTSTNTPTVVVPLFNSDSAYGFVKAQCDFGPRMPNTKQHDACAVYLADKMRTYCDTVIVQKGQVTTFNKIKLNIQNIICSFNPGIQNRILLFAHWDTRPWADQDSVRKDEPILGADDAGSGVAVLMEVARIIAQQKISTGIDIVFFDAEDYGTRREDPADDDSYALGTQYWCRNPMPENYTANFGILLDMVGARNATFYIEGYSKQYASFVVEKVWGAANRLGFSSHFIYADGGFVTDDHVYPNQILNIPCIDIINTNPANQHGGFPNHWHTHNDNMDVIDKNTLNAVGQTLLEIVFSGQGA
ncbi:MAG: M28 family peptidase [Bacteroidota bacterium]